MPNDFDMIGLTSTGDGIYKFTTVGPAGKLIGQEILGKVLDSDGYSQSDMTWVQTRSSE
jgi:hypothetical protein